MVMMACAMMSSRFLEKLSNAGPANGLMSNAVRANALTTVPTMSAVAPKWSM